MIIEEEKNLKLKKSTLVIVIDLQKVVAVLLTLAKINFQKKIYLNKIIKIILLVMQNLEMKTNSKENMIIMES